MSLRLGADVVRDLHRPPGDEIEQSATKVRFEGQVTVLETDQALMEHGGLRSEFLAPGLQDHYLAG